MRTSALRLSVVYAAIFAAALLALVFVIYLLTARFIDAEVDTAIERDAAGFLEAYAQMSPGALERIEALEQLRVLFNGFPIKLVVTATAPAAGIDTPEDLAAVRRRFVLP